ncbi:hypothetical protein [Polymorphum gilvum]|uniref:CheA signal transduction histidine kinase n=1 Tax=Polymorphum gilvum (strain LMG 25793 / CGMCC 1.9160 / SL003B-26A1) TaxID=991905 RepID=F2IX73_POLGS|nr:hypothetical protein [Polymorphum gilvum]ADZ69364.1 hypothetical protein SL003B_0935 [Polymorphum gilvum SL003B-26A1]
MADYYSILKKTIASLPENNGAARRSVYSRARNAIVNQLKAYEPPLSPSEITAEQLRLEEAIRKVEAEAARETLGLGRPAAAEQAAPIPTVQVPSSATQSVSTAPAATPPPSPPAPSPAAPSPAAPARAPLGAPLGTAVRDAEKLGAASSRAVQSAKDAFSPDAEAGEASPPRREPTFGASTGPRAPVQPEPGPLSALTGPRDFSGDTRIRTADAGERKRSGDFGATAAPEEAPVAEEAKRPRRPQPRASDRGKASTLTSYVLLAGLVLIVIGIGAVVYSQRDTLSDLFAGDSSPPEVAVAPQAPEPAQAPAPVEENGARSEKSTDRLLDDNGQPAAPDARSVTTTLITPTQPAGGTIVTPSGDVEATPAPTQPAPAPAPLEPPPAAEAPAVVPAPAAPTAEVAPETIVAQRSILYEEGEDASGSGTASQGRVAWSVTEETDASGRKETVLAANAEIPDRNVSVTIRIKPNTDSSLPASHLVEVQFQLPEGFSGRDVANVPGLVMKPTEEARGDALLGASVKVAPGYFWIALSSIESERERNIALMRERGWIDIPILYDTGKRAILTLEKGTPGSRALEQAMTVWGSGG